MAGSSRVLSRLGGASGATVRSIRLPLKDPGSSVAEVMPLLGPTLSPASRLLLEVERTASRSALPTDVKLNRPLFLPRLSLGLLTASAESFGVPDSEGERGCDTEGTR